MPKISADLRRVAPSKASSRSALLQKRNLARLLRHLTNPTNLRMGEFQRSRLGCCLKHGLCILLRFDIIEDIAESVMVLIGSAVAIPLAIVIAEGSLPKGSGLVFGFRRDRVW